MTSDGQQARVASEGRDGVAGRMRDFLRDESRSYRLAPWLDPLAVDNNGMIESEPTLVEDVEPNASVSTGASLSMRLQVLAVGMAVAGGLLGVVGSIEREVQSSSMLGAAVIEEAVKPAGIYILLIHWPLVLRGQLHTAALTALSGLCFGLVEAVVYVTLYFPEGGSDFVLFRFTVPLVLHTVASFIVGLGLNRGLIEWASGRGKLPRSTRNCFLVGMGLHEVYNVSVFVLALVGLLSFE